MSVLFHYDRIIVYSNTQESVKERKTITITFKNKYTDRNQIETQKFCVGICGLHNLIKCYRDKFI